MAKKRLLWQLYPTYLVITLIALLAVGWYALNAMEEFYYRQTAADLEARARLVQRQVADLFHPKHAARLDRLSKELGKSASTRITFILPSGKVLGDSHEDPARMDNHSNRQEVGEALEGKTGTSIRFSRTVGENLMYFAVPLMENERVVGVVRTSRSLNSIDSALRSTQLKIAFGGVVIALLAAVISLMVSRRISRPLEAMKLGAEGFARGDLAQNIPIPESFEMGALAEALNQMAVQLDERIRTITAQSNEREAVLSSMVEGVLAVDAQERVISLNHAAARLMSVDSARAKGRPIEEVVRNSDLQKFVQTALTSREAVEQEIVLGDGNERVLQVRATVLQDGRDHSIGALVVLNDVTRLRRLENIRKDFVANVSHELKTPITSIKGFVETLQQGAIDQPQEARRFLEIIERHTDRLNAILDDLLSLSRIEQESETPALPLETTRLREVLQVAVQSLEIKASERNVQVDLVCAEELEARINPPLLEQAVVNLVDNAIKYGDPEKGVQVEAREEPSGIIIQVRDWGRGIEKKHLSRLFERFYRIDPARSRTLGGTGLGLAIVKHIAQAHRGSVSVQSRPGEGSVFSIHLPKA